MPEKLRMDRGVKTGLFTEEQIKAIKKRRGPRKKKHVFVRQTNFLETVGEGSENACSDITYQDLIDPERDIFMQGRIYNDPRGASYKYSPVNKEIKWKKDKLRGLIGLPVARGNDEHVNDKTYKMLVRRVCMNDEFGIFGEYDRAMGELPVELVSKIEEVEEIMSNVLGSDLGHIKKGKKLTQELETFKERWDI